MSQTITQSRLRIDANFKRFVDEEVLPGTGLDAAAFWRNFDEIVHDLAPENRQLLAERDRIQAALDEWHRSNPGPVKVNHRHQVVGDFGGGREDGGHLPLPGIAFQNIGNPQKTFCICH